MTRRSSTARVGARQRLWLAGTFGLTSLLALSGCASLGGNVRGSFSCAAPDGICAPSATIDDRALALISADASEADTLPTGNQRQPMRGRSNRAEAIQPARLAVADAGRTQEKVLRIVFQPYIDERGRLHEASAVHAVVARGEWQQQALMQASLPRRLCRNRWPTRSTGPIHRWRVSPSLIRMPRIRLPLLPRGHASPMRRQIRSEQSKRMSGRVLPPGRKRHPARDRRRL